MIRYIHANPVKAGITKKIEKYKWSSCKEYYNNNRYKLVDPEFILDLFESKKELAIEYFKKFMEEENDDSCLDLNYKEKIKDKRLKEEIIKLLNGKPASALQKMDKKNRDNILKEVKKIEGSTIRQIARITGLGIYIIHKA